MHSFNLRQGVQKILNIEKDIEKKYRKYFFLNKWMVVWNQKNFIKKYSPQLGIKYVLF